MEWRYILCFNQGKENRQKNYYTCQHWGTAHSLQIPDVYAAINISLLFFLLRSYLSFKGWLCEFRGFYSVWSWAVQNHPSLESSQWTLSSHRQPEAFLIGLAFRLPKATEHPGWGGEDTVREAPSGWVSTVAQAEEGISTVGFHWFQIPSRVRSTSVLEGGQPCVQCHSLRGVRRQVVPGGGQG